MRTKESLASPFLEALKRDIRLRGYSIRTEKTYLYYIRCYIHFIGKRHPDQAGASEVKAFLSHLACDRGALRIRGLSISSITLGSSC